MENDILLFYNIIVLFLCFISSYVGFSSLLFLLAVNFFTGLWTIQKKIIGFILYQYNGIISPTKSFPRKSQFRKYCDAPIILTRIVDGCAGGCGSASFTTLDFVRPAGLSVPRYIMRKSSNDGRAAREYDDARDRYSHRPYVLLCHTLLCFIRIPNI